MSDRSDQEMDALKATAWPVVPEPVPTGYEVAGDVLVKAGGFLFWAAIWFYLESGKVERRRERELARDLA